MELINGRVIFSVNFKKLGLIVALCLAMIVGTLIAIRDHVIEKTEFIPDITDLTHNYLAEDEIPRKKGRRRI